MLSARAGGSTYGDPVGDEIALVDHEHDLLVRLLLADELQYRLAERAQGVPGVDDMDDHVRGVDDLVELPVNATGRPLGIDGLNDIRVGLEFVGSCRGRSGAYMGVIKSDNDDSLEGTHLTLRRLLASHCSQPRPPLPH